MTARVRFDCSGQCIAFTGGGGLIARECARLVVAGGGHVHLVDPREDALSAAADELSRGPGTVSTAVGALACAASCRAALAAAGAPLDGLAHLAGVFEEDPFVAPETGRDSPVWERALESNLATAYRVGSVFDAVRRRDAPTRLVFTSSMAAERGAPWHVAYATAKAGLHGLVRSLARRMAPEVIVNGVSPGLIESPMADALIHRLGHKGHREGSLRRYGRGEEIARVVLFLLSDGASYFTGQMLRVDGGASMK